MRLVSVLALAFAAVACGGPTEDDELAVAEALATASATCSVTPDPAAAGGAITVTGAGFGSKRYLDFVAYAGAYPGDEIAVYAGITDNRGNITIPGLAPAQAGSYQLIAWKDFGARSQVAAASCAFEVQ
jgi:hypothetical protein